MPLQLPARAEPVGGAVGAICSVPTATVTVAGGAESDCVLHSAYLGLAPPLAPLSEHCTEVSLLSAAADCSAGTCHEAYFDSCTSYPLFRDASYFEHLIPLAQPVSIQMADQGSTFLAYEHGPVSFFILNSTSGRLIKVRLSDALHVPTLQ